jgi:DNA-binding NarL/FixJ family response regulator
VANVAISIPGGKHMMKTKVFLVDDHGMMRSGLKALLQDDESLEIVGEADQGRSAVQMIAKSSPEVVVMDLRMPDMNGIEATRQIVGTNPATKVIGLSANTDRQSVVEMLRAGAKGYVIKESAFEELAMAIKMVLQDKIYLSPAVTNLVVEDWVQGEEAAVSVFGVLSAREREVLQLIAEGKATKEVAAVLNVSLKTAESHRRNLMEKLHVESVAELTKYAIREGITEL